ncbi:glycosyltransferase involved in cell wall biosynthesis [Peribacillus sp. B2I2]|uniref:glycosyltransferase n=1 Tax=Peribacillus sp. B2I2 TaxID=3156468 RepID=UPI0035186E2E
MRILYLNNTMVLGGGVQKCIFLLASRFSYDNKIFVASSGGEYVKDLISKGIKHYDIINPEKKNPISIVKNLITLYRIIKKNEIEVIHSHHRMTTLYAKCLSRILGVKVIHSAHLYTTDKKLLTKYTLKDLPILSVSNGVKDGLIGYYKQEEKNIRTIYNTIEFNEETSEMNEKFLMEKAKKNFIIGVVSRLEPVKGIDLILKAINEISSKSNDCSNIRVFIFGDGKLKKEFETYIKDHGLEDIVTLVGKVNNIKEYMKNFDLMIQSSYQEGLPLSLIEATSLGIPIVATDIPGTNEVVINNFNGLLVPSGSYTAISKAIIKVFNNKEYRVQISEKSISHFKRNFSKENYYDGHMDFYNLVCKTN